MAFENDPVKAARAIAGAVTELNHASRDSTRLSAPEISATVRGLVDAIDGLPQALEQLAGHLQRELTAGRVRVEDGRDPAGPVDQVLAALRNAVTITEPANGDEWGTPAGALAEPLHDAAGWLRSMGAVAAADAEGAGR
ncbi:hypothetical protein ACIQI7_32625 [Kitasatospora sp. NPDC092039]|uniref:hypothetical protein n=1 Tax=Kitasatospora sp. NPDC092039 TaxID=3364086 RepID=UPI00380924F8